MIFLSPWLRDSITQGTWPLTINASSIRNGYIYNSSGNDGDGVNFKAYFAAGTYTCKIVGTEQDQRAILKIKVDGVTVATYDQNNDGGLEWNTIHTQAGIVIGSAGVKTIQAVIDGKTGTAFAVTISEIVFFRTA